MLSPSRTGEVVQKVRFWASFFKKKFVLYLIKIIRVCHQTHSKSILSTLHPFSFEYTYFGIDIFCAELEYTTGRPLTPYISQRQ